MKRTLFLILVLTGLLALALGAWTVQGVRWALTGGWTASAPQPA